MGRTTARNMAVGAYHEGNAVELRQHRRRHHLRHGHCRDTVEHVDQLIKLVVRRRVVRRL
jgi:hypothetical protein